MSNKENKELGNEYDEESEQINHEMNIDDPKCDSIFNTPLLTPGSRQGAVKKALSQLKRNIYPWLSSIAEKRLLPVLCMPFQRQSKKIHTSNESRIIDFQDGKKVIKVNVTDIKLIYDKSEEVLKNLNGIIPSNNQETNNKKKSDLSTLAFENFISRFDFNAGQNEIANKALRSELNKDDIILLNEHCMNSNVIKEEENIDWGSSSDSETD